MDEKILEAVRKRRNKAAKKFYGELKRQTDLTQNEREFLMFVFEKRNQIGKLKRQFKAQYRSVIKKGYIQVVWSEARGRLEDKRIEAFPRFYVNNLFELAKEQEHKKERVTKGEKREYTKEELEAQLEPIACKLDKRFYPEVQDIVQVVLPWLDDANDCMEVYLIRNEHGKIELAFD